MQIPKLSLNPNLSFANRCQNNMCTHGSITSACRAGPFTLRQSLVGIFGSVSMDRDMAVPKTLHEENLRKLEKSVPR